MSGDEELENLFAVGLANLPNPLSDEELARVMEEEARRDTERARRAHEDRWTGLVPKRFLWARPGAAEMASRCRPVRKDGTRATVEEAIRAIENHQGPVIVMGPPGSGKTSLAIAAMRSLYDKRVRLVRYVDAFALGLARIQHPAGSGEAPIVEAAMSANLLLVDDIGQERQTQNNAVPDVLLSRHADDLQTWITTGETMEQLAAKYGGGVARRIREGALVVRCEAKKESK